MVNSNTAAETETIYKNICYVMDLATSIFFFMFPASLGLNAITGGIVLLYVARTVWEMVKTNTGKNYGEFLNRHGYLSGKLPLYYATICIICLSSTAGPIAAGLFKTFTESLTISNAAFQVAARNLTGAVAIIFFVQKFIIKQWSQTLGSDQALSHLNTIEAHHNDTTAQVDIEHIRQSNKARDKIENWAAQGWYYRQMLAQTAMEITGAVLSLTQVGLPLASTVLISVKVIAAACAISTISQVLNDQISATKESQTKNGNQMRDHDSTQGASTSQESEPPLLKLTQDFLILRLWSNFLSAAQGIFTKLPQDLCKNNILPLILLVSTLSIDLPLTASTTFTLPQLLTTASIVGLMFSKMLEPAANLKLTADAQVAFNNSNTLEIGDLERLLHSPNDCEKRQQWWRDLSDSLALIATAIVSMQMLGISPIPLHLPQFICLGILGASFAFGTWRMAKCFVFDTDTNPQAASPLLQRISNHFSHSFFNTATSSFALRLMFMFQAHIPTNYMMWITLGYMQTFAAQAIVVTAILNLALTLTITPLLTASLDESYETYKSHIIDSKNRKETPSLLGKIFKMITQLFTPGQTLHNQLKHTIRYGCFEIAPEAATNFAQGAGNLSHTVRQQVSSAAQSLGSYCNNIVQAATIAKG